MTAYYRSFTVFSILIAALFTPGAVNAQSYAQLADTSVTVFTTLEEHRQAPPAEVTSPLLSNLQLKLLNADDRKQLFAALKYNPNNLQLSNLANAFAQLKLYPLAMKCFLKRHAYPLDSAVTNNPGVFEFNSRDSILLEEQAKLLQVKTKHISKEIPYRHIADTFNDGKIAAGYAVLIHTKQPISGKHKVHLLADAGHSFVTLIKYNADSSTTSLSFGFYPKKKNPFAGSPLFPSASSTFKNDSHYNWDEVVGRFVSPQTFQCILQKAKEYDGVRYHLSKRNCTDFTLDIASIAGIRINETVGKWPLGKGNNPGITGQSILTGGVQATGKGDNPLFIGYNDKVLPLAAHNPADY